jgi:hypothetical protein
MIRKTTTEMPNASTITPASRLMRYLVMASFPA